MKTSIIEATDMLSVLSVDEVKKRFGDVPGVASATVNYAAKNVTVRYDETLLEVADIKVIVHQRGQHSTGESQDKDVSADKPKDELKHQPEQNAGAKPKLEAAPAPTAPPKPAMPKVTPVAPVIEPKPTVPAGDGQSGKDAATASHQHP